VPALFRRKSTASVIEETATDDAVVTERQTRSYTPSKRDQGVTTPKRGSQQVRRPGAPAAAKNSPEQAKAVRSLARQKRLDDRAAMMRGEESALLARDRGPEKRLVRNIVDARRNIGSYFFGIVLVLLLLSSVSPGLLALGDLIFLFMLLTIAVDSYFLSRRIKRVVAERFPKSTVRGGVLYRYGIMRALSLRFMRIPKPQVKTGTKLSQIAS
jgi:hypothetical protein